MTDVKCQDCGEHGPSVAWLTAHKKTCRGGKWQQGRVKMGGQRLHGQARIEETKEHGHYDLLIRIPVYESDGIAAAQERLREIFEVDK